MSIVQRAKSMEHKEDNISGCRMFSRDLLSQDGSALIITVLLVAVLVGIVVEFAYDVYIDSAALSNWSNAQKASLAARSGQVLGTQYLEEVMKNDFTYDREKEVPVERDIGEDTQLTLMVGDENAKFNVNSIIYSNGRPNDNALAVLKRLLKNLRIDENAALYIADWIDPDSEPLIADSEDNAKNDFLWSIDELRETGILERSAFDRLRPFVTIYGEGVNINTAELPVLMSLHGDMTETLAKRIIDYRETSPFEAVSDVQKVSGMEQIGTLLIGKATVKSSFFRISSRASVRDITREIESVVDRSMMVHSWREI